MVLPLGRGLEKGKEGVETYCYLLASKFSGEAVARVSLLPEQGGMKEVLVSGGAEKFHVRDMCMEHTLGSAGLAGVAA